MASALYVDDIYLAGKGGLPLGFIYIQMPNTPDPDELFTGTWENVSSSYAGDFLRNEGGDASAFESGQQLDQMQKITGQIEAEGLSTPDTGNDDFVGAFSRGVSPSLARVSGTNPTTNQRFLFDSSDSPDARTGAGTDGETRAVNRTVRVWKRAS